MNIFWLDEFQKFYLNMYLMKLIDDNVGNEEN